MLTAVQEPIVVEKILLAANNLPAFSPASQQAVKLVNTENVKIPNLAAAISADQTLTIDLLRIVNSSAFGLPRQITKVQEAISYAGLDQTRRLIYAATARRMFGQRQSREMWQHSITSAFVAEGLAFFADSYLDPYDAYLAGLTHDVGKTLLRTRFSKEYAAMISSMPPNEPWRLLEAERVTFSLDHAQVGAVMMEKWNLASDLCAAVKNHHNPAQPGQALCQVLAIANQTAHQYDTPKEHRVFDHHVLSSIHLRKDDADNMLFYAQHKIDDFLSKIAGSLF